MSSSENSDQAQEGSARDSNQNPYQLIKQMNRVIQQQKQQISEYQLAFNSLQGEKMIILSEKSRFQRQCEYLSAKLQLLRTHCNQSPVNKALPLNSRVSNLKNFNKFCSPLLHKKQLSGLWSPSLHRPQLNSRQESVKSPAQLKNPPENINTKRSSLKEEDEYIPEPISVGIKAGKSKAQQMKPNTNHLALQTHNYGEGLIEDFIVIGPQLNTFKDKKSKIKEGIIITQPSSLYNFTPFYKNQKQNFINEIIKRAFPDNCTLTRKLIQSKQSLYNLFDHKPCNTLGQDYFVFTLNGDPSLLNRKKKVLLDYCNPDYFLYVICLKLPDLVENRNERNYQKKDSQVWLTEKVYAIVTYYPLLTIFAALLYRIHDIIRSIFIRKVILGSQSPLLWGMTEKCHDLQRNQDIRDLLTYFTHMRPDYSQICSFSTNYFGMLPEPGYDSIYSIALATCPVLFSNFCFEQFLILLTAAFSEKTLIFLSESESLATMSALFLMNLIYPFRFPQSLLLNCDSSKIQSMIFELPFGIICSIKRTQSNISQILSYFAQKNVERYPENDAQYILIDIDSNSILYHQVLEDRLVSCLAHPGEQAKKAYSLVNSCQSKSFSLPKALPKENFRPREKPRSDYQKKSEEKKKFMRQYMQKIMTNKTKKSTYKRLQQHENLLKILTEYVQSFTIDTQTAQKIRKLKNKNQRSDIVKEYLIQKPIHRNRNKTVENIIQNQMYANYLDQLNNQINTYSF